MQSPTQVSSKGLSIILLHLVWRNSPWHSFLLLRLTYSTLSLPSKNFFWWCTNIKWVRNFLESCGTHTMESFLIGFPGALQSVLNILLTTCLPMEQVLMIYYWGVSLTLWPHRSFYFLSPNMLSVKWLDPMILSWHPGLFLGFYSLNSDSARSKLMS